MADSGPQNLQKNVIIDPNVDIIFNLVLIGNSLKNLMCLIQMFVGQLLKGCYVFQSTRYGDILS